MITSGGPYQTNPALVAKIRDLASIVNRIGGIQKGNPKTQWLSEAKFKQESIQYASPPVRGKLKDKAEDQEIVEPEHSVSSVITGLHKPGSRQRHRMRTPGSTGHSNAGGGSPSNRTNGAYRT